MNISVVIPTIRTLDFLKEWKDKFKGCDLVIVEDHPEQIIETPSGTYKSVHHFTWNHIKEDFGSDEWIFSRKNAGIRSYGFWKAYQAGADVIITLDDDCFPIEKDFIKKHVENLSVKAPDRWFATFPHPEFLYTRGFPYDVRNAQTTVISHGLWSKVVDLDAKTQLQHIEINIPAYPHICQFVPKGYYFPMSSMNLAFSREVTPLMYFPLMGSDPEGNPWGFDRYDDIWAGIFAKKIIDHLKMAAVNGSPFVEHRKASDPHQNLIKEKTGMEENEYLWKWTDAVVLTKTTPAACYLELAQKIAFPKTRYFDRLKKAMILWATLFLQSGNG